MGGQNLGNAKDREAALQQQQQQTVVQQTTPIEGGHGKGVVITNPSASSQGLKEATYGSAPSSASQSEAVISKPTENYGYSSSVVVSPVIKQATNENPLDVNFELAKNRNAVVARNRFKENLNPIQGGVETPQSKGKSFGSSWIGGQRESIGAKIFSNQNQIYRNSPLEEAIKSSEAKRAESIYPKTIGTKTGYEPSITVKPIESSTTFKDTFAPNEKVTTATKSGLLNLVDINAIKGDIFFGNSTKEKPLTEKEVSAKNDEIKLMNQQIQQQNDQIGIGNSVISLGNQQTEFNNKVERNQFIGNLIAKANTVGGNKIDILSSDNKILESVPLSKAKDQLPKILDKYSNQNVTFSVTPKTISTTKETITPSSILALDLNYLSSKDFTGKYFNLEQQASGFFLEQKSAAGLPATSGTSKLFGITVPDVNLTLKETGANFGAYLKDTVKGIIPLTIGLGQEYYNLATTGKSGSKVQVKSVQDFFGNIAHKVFYPSDIMAPNAVGRMKSSQEYIHLNIGQPIKESGLPIPQTVQNPKTVGAFVGTTLGIASGLPLKSPFSREPIILEGKVMARMPSGEGFVEVPGVIKISGVTLGTGKYAIGLGMKSTEGTKIPFISTLRPETPYMRTILGKVEATSKLGAEAGAVTNLTAAKLYTGKGAKVLSDIGVVAEEQQKGLVNLGYEISKKGDFGKITNVNIPKKDFTESLRKMVLTGNPETNVAMVTELGKEQPKTVPVVKGSLGNVLPINYFNKLLGKESAGLYASYLAKPNKSFPIGFPKSESPIPVRGVETIHDIDADLQRLEQRQKQEGRENAKLDINSEEYKKIIASDVLQSENILNLLQTKVKTPLGFGFAKSGITNIAFGKITKLGKTGLPEKVQGETVLNLLGIKEEINTEGAAGASSKYTGGRSFNVAPPEGEVNYGGIFKVKTISYQAWAKMKSVLSYQSAETFGKFKNAAPEIYAKTSFQGKRNVIFPPLKRVKDITDLYSISRYAERTTRGGTSKRFGQLAENLRTNYPQIDWSVIEENAKNTKFVFTKEAIQSIQSESTRLNPPSGKVIPVSQLAIISPSRNQNTNTSLKNTLSSFSNISKLSGKGTSYRVLSGSTSSKLSPKSNKSPTSIISGSTKSQSPKSSFSPTSPKSAYPKSFKSPSSPLSPSGKVSSTSPYYPSSPSSPSPRITSVRSPSMFSPISPTSPSGRLPPLPPSTFQFLNAPTNKKIILPRLGAFPRRPRYRPYEKPTRTFLYNVSNIFASSLSIKEPAKQRYSQFL